MLGHAAVGVLGFRLTELKHVIGLAKLNYQHDFKYDHINKLLNSKKMRTKQVTPEFDAERLGKKDALQQHVTDQTKKRLSDGDKEQDAVSLPAELPPSKKQNQNVSDKTVMQTPACSNRCVRC